MPWIETIDEADAEGALKHAYDEIAKLRGKLSNVVRVHSLHPSAMRAHIDLYLSLMFERSDLSRADRELIATVVSAKNACGYCVRHHSEALLAYWKDPERVARAVDDYRVLDLPERTRAMLDYALLLTERPSAVTQAYVQGLREVGFTDRAILDLNLITSYFNFVNRIAEGLGVEFSEDEARGYRY